MQVVDSVLGQPWPFPPATVQRAGMAMEVTAINGDRVTLRLTGATRPTEKDRALELTLLGRATYDLKCARFVTFELVATGTRRGSRHRAPYVGEPAGGGSIGFAFVLAGDAPADRTAPAFFAASGWAR
jgi:hypothetical protein